MKQVQLTFYKDEMFADIEARCNVIANAAETEEKKLTDTRDVLDDGNREVIEGSMSRLLFDSMKLLYPFVKTPIRHCYEDNKDGEVEVYVIELSFPYERSETDVQLLKRNIQSYIVYESVAEWLTMTMPDSNQWQIWEKKAADQREAIATALVMPMNVKAVSVKSHLFE